MTREVSSYKAYTQIKSQPSELQRIMTASEPVAAAADKLATARRVFVVGTGTSYNATLFATHCLRTIGVEASPWDRLRLCCLRANARSHRRCHCIQP